MGYEEHKAKQTHYGGIWFDSNMEAKTAESLDILGIPFEFHTKCFRDRRFPYKQYTPDFYLPSTDAYIEVCGVFDKRHEDNVRTLCDILQVGTDGAPRVMVVGSGTGFTEGCYIDEGRLVMRPVSWHTDDGRTSCDLFWLVGL